MHAGRVCRDGMLECEGAIDLRSETCDNLDNDCDGIIDEALPLGELCVGTCTTDICATVSCASGEVCDPSGGGCVEDLCVGVRCPTGSLRDSVTGECSADPCDTLRRA